MIYIAICEDSEDDLQILKNYLNEYRILRNYENKIRIFSYNSSLTLCKDLQDGKIFDIYFLDILLPHVNGIELGQQIREFDHGSAIVYLSTSSEYFPEAFNLYAFQYQIKPVQKEKIFEIMDRLFNQYSLKHSKTFLLHKKETYIRLAYEEICYVELLNRIIHFHLLNGQVEQSNYIRSSFDKLMKPLLVEPNFVHPHKSYIVNLNYVRRFQSKAFEMIDGTQIPISRTRLPDIKMASTLYMLNKDTHFF